MNAMTSPGGAANPKGRPKITRRTIQAADTRDLIVATAAELFTSQGYVQTTMEQIAAGSGVALQTVYNSVGNKVALLSAVLDTAASGPNAPARVMDFMQERTAHAHDLTALLMVLADWFVEVHQRTSAIFGTIVQAAAVDPVVAQLEKDRALQRLRNYREAAAGVRARGGLGSGMSDEEAAAAIFSLGHPLAYRTLVTDGGWSLAAYRNWILKSLTAALA